MGRNKKQIEAKEPINLRFQKRVGDRKAILVDHYHDGKHHYENTGLILLPETNEKSRRENARTMRKAEEILRERITQHLSSAASPLQKEKTVTIVEWFDFFIEEQKRRQVRDAKRMKCIKDILMEIDPLKALIDVDKDYCLRLITYLRDEYLTPKGKHIAPKTIFNICGYFCTSLNMAVQMGKIPFNPWNKLSQNEKPKNRGTKRDYLTIPEVKALISTPCKKSIVKQAYLFSCFCGLRLGDVMSLKWSDITDDGPKWLVGIVTSKNRKPLHLPLSGQARKWMPERSHDLVFPDLTLYCLNKALGEWAEAAGISKKVTFHTARHTFATMLLTLGTDIYTVSKMLGHSSVKPTQIYAKIIDEAKDDAVALADNINWSQTLS